MSLESFSYKILFTFLGLSGASNLFDIRQLFSNLPKDKTYPDSYIAFYACLLNTVQYG